MGNLWMFDQMFLRVSCDSSSRVHDFAPREEVDVLDVDMNSIGGNVRERRRQFVQRLQLMQRNVAARPRAQSTDRCDNAIQCVCCVVRVNMQKCADTLWYASSARL